ncbi:MAG: 2-dehydro-3-deoxygalactonokinase, partial [Burkholderiales bacterium]|nr:2-dehydro-3-deoxygalactonokinase [Burkholderiales bacterium]
MTGASAAPGPDAASAGAAGAARLIALDWGTSSLRAYRLGAAGQVLEARHRPWGILHLPEAGERGFAAVLQRI